MAIKRIARKLAVPYTVTEVKSHIRVDISNDDTLIERLLRAATERVEDMTGRSLLVTQWQLVLHGFPNSANTPIKIPRPPLISLDSITYVDNNGDTQTWSSANYNVFNSDKDKCAYVLPVFNGEYPTTRNYPESVTIKFTAGYQQAITADDSTDKITLTAHPFEDSSVIRFFTSDTLPGGLSEGTNYYGRDTEADAFKVATSDGGSAVDITDTGTGTHYVSYVPDEIGLAIMSLVGHWYNHREPWNANVNMMPVPESYYGLVTDYTVWSFE